MKAAELRALCELRGLKVHRAKADMIEELEAYDAGSGDVLPASEEVEAPVDLNKAERAPDSDVWVSDGRLYKRFPKDDIYLGDAEHFRNLLDVVDEAVNLRRVTYGPAFRAADKCGAEFWVYAVNVR
jgi:hypothetical protein